MNDTDLEARIARLERQAAVWKIVGLGALLVSGGMIMNACSTKATPPPTAFELKGKDGQVDISGDAITLQKGDSRVVIEPDKITLVAGKKTVTVTPGQLLAESDTGRLTLAPDQLELANATHQIEGRLSGEGPTLALKNGAQAVELAAFKDVSAVSATTTIESPTERVSAGLSSNSQGASVSASRIGETKSLETRKPATER